MKIDRRCWQTTWWRNFKTIIVSQFCVGRFFMSHIGRFLAAALPSTKRSTNQSAAFTFLFWPTEKLVNFPQQWSTSIRLWLLACMARNMASELVNTRLDYRIRHLQAPASADAANTSRLYAECTCTRRSEQNASIVINHKPHWLPINYRIKYEVADRWHPYIYSTSLYILDTYAHHLNSFFSWML